jgi:hypothetical protein
VLTVTDLNLAGSLAVSISGWVVFGIGGGQVLQSSTYCRAKIANYGSPSLMVQC